MASRYRPEIDGLRALAILPVVLFHAGVKGTAGGFVGVDVFFVISGFLITSLIVSDLSAGRFSLAAFWERRARRILPAQIVMVLAVLLAGWFLLLPHDYRSLGQQAAAQGVFAANMLFFRQSGYFDGDNNTKPLLHLWSLAVEEQFYFVFPLLLLAVWKTRPDWLRPAVGAVFAVSLAADVVCVAHYPVAGFYLFPARAWELALGAWLAFGKGSAKGWLNEVLSGVGLAAILAAVLLYDQATPFPGLAALMPCLGAAAIIAGNGQGQTAAGRLLSCRPLVFIGLVSYSWYLWHWPFIVFARYVSPGPLPPPVMTCCVVAGFIAAVLSWKYIETPFRRKTWLPERRRMLGAACAALALTAGAGVLLHLTNGYPGRYDPDVLALADGVNDKNTHQGECNRPSLAAIGADRVCETDADGGKPDFIVWGDSYADAMAPAFYRLSVDYKKNGYIAAFDGCPPILGLEQRGRGDDFYCRAFNDEIFKLIERKKIKHVFLIGAWANWLKNDRIYMPGVNGSGGVVALPALRKTIAALVARGVAVHILQNVPVAPFDPPRALALQALFHPGGPPPVIAMEDYETQKRAMTAFLMMPWEGAVSFIDPSPLLCHENGCKVVENGRSLYYNSDHISATGAVYLSGLFAPVFSKLR